MKIAIVGMGKLGRNVATTLSGGGHDITAIDIRESLLQKLSSRMDIMTVNLDAKDIRNLKDIGIASYDYLIATTGNDETNLIIAAFAKKLGCSRVMARVGDPEHMNQFDFIRNLLKIDHIINPDFSITNEIYKYLVEKYALSDAVMTNGGIGILEFDPRTIKELDGLEIKNFHSVLPDMLALGISRNGKVIIPHGCDIINAENDDLFVIGKKDAIIALDEKVHNTSRKNNKTDIQKVMIMGGGKTGFYLAKKLSEYGVSVKIIEQDKDRCYYLSEELDDVLVLCGDATDQTLLADEGFATMDAVVACTGFDEDNLLLALTAKQQGIEDVIAKISHDNYTDIISNLGIDMVLNPLDISTSSIVHAIDGNKKVIFSALIQGQAELMEVIASSHMSIINKPLKDLDLPKSVLIAAIQRGSEVIIPNGSTKIKEGDRVFMFTLLSNLSQSEKLIQEKGRLKIFGR